MQCTVVCDAARGLVLLAMAGFVTELSVVSCAVVVVVWFFDTFVHGSRSISPEISLGSRLS